MPYLRSEYGKDYDFDAPVKLLDSMMHAMADEPDQQVIVLSQVHCCFFMYDWRNMICADKHVPGALHLSE